MFNTPKARTTDLVKPAFKPSVPAGVGFSSPVSPSLKSNRKVKAKTPATSSSRNPVPSYSMESSSHPSWVTTARGSSGRQRKDSDSSVPSPYTSISNMFKNFDTSRDSSKRRREERIMSYTVPDMLVTEEQGDPTKELFVKEKVGVVKKINFENVAADAISEGCASD